MYKPDETDGLSSLSFDNIVVRSIRVQPQFIKQLFIFTNAYKTKLCFVQSVIRLSDD